VNEEPKGGKEYYNQHHKNNKEGGHKKMGRTKTGRRDKCVEGKE